MRPYFGGSPIRGSAVVPAVEVVVHTHICGLVVSCSTDLWIGGFLQYRSVGWWFLAVQICGLVASCSTDLWVGGFLQYRSVGWWFLAVQICGLVVSCSTDL